MKTIKYAIRREDRRAAGMFAVNHTDPYKYGFKYSETLEGATLWDTAAAAAENLEIRLRRYYAGKESHFVLVPVEVQTTLSFSLAGH